MQLSRGFNSTLIILCMGYGYKTTEIVFKEKCFSKKSQFIKNSELINFTAEDLVN